MNRCTREIQQSAYISVFIIALRVLTIHSVLHLYVYTRLPVYVKSRWKIDVNLEKTKDFINENNIRYFAFIFQTICAILHLYMFLTVKVLFFCYQSGGENNVKFFDSLYNISKSFKSTTYLHAWSQPLHHNQLLLEIHFHPPFNLMPL